MKLSALCFCLITIVSPLAVHSQCAPLKNFPLMTECAAIQVSSQSGNGKDWSQFYEITASAPAADYILVAYDFFLNGPHPCTARGQVGFAQQLGGFVSISAGKSEKIGVGAWAECSVSAETGVSVKFKYRIQGSEDTTFVIQGQSIGWDTKKSRITENAVLRSVWIKQADADTITQLFRRAPR